MAKFDDDDFMDSLSDWDDDDLLLLDPEAGKFETPTVQSGKSASAQSSPRSRSDASGGSSPRAASEERSSRSKKKGRGGLIVLIVILILLIIAIAVFLFKLNAAGGKLSALFGSSDQTEAVDDTEAEDTDGEDASAEDETEAEEAEDTEAEDTADTEDTEETETEEEPLVVESEETSTDLSGLALLELYGEDFTPDLVYVSYYGVHQSTGDLQVDSSITANLASFIAAAQEAGYGTMLSTCYYEAGSGNSDEAQEHATGLAVDLVDVNAQVKATFASDETYADEIAWLADNAADYGFILRYPEGKEDLTGVDYVPYHFVYVGTTIAQEMAENDWCLEEYLAQ